MIYFYFLIFFFFFNFFYLKKQILKASENKLTDLSNLEEGLINWGELTEVHLGSNQLKTLPPKVKFLKKMKVLDLTKNQIESLPKQLFWLKSTIRKLLLSYNKIKNFPGDISYLDPSLKLELDHNPLDGGTQQAYGKNDYFYFKFFYYFLLFFIIFYFLFFFLF